jgi:deazaflavin-dependent oxidoreductase (nitroreductase family)
VEGRVDFSQMNDWNRQVIEEFRANGGKVGGRFEGAPMVLLHTIGAKSGQERVNPLVYFPDGDNVVIVASKAGAPTNPDWYHNIKANPEVTVEIGAETKRMRARIPERSERDAYYERIVAVMPGFGEYQQNTERVIPVVVLEPVAG